MLDLCKSEVCDLGDTFVGDENIGRFAVSVDDRWLVIVEVLDPTGDVEHHTHLLDGLERYREESPSNGLPFFEQLGPRRHEGSQTDPRSSRVR